MDKRKFFSKFYIVLFTCMLMLPCYTKDVSGAEWIPYFIGDSLFFFYDAESVNYLPSNVIRVWIKSIPESEEDRAREIQIQRNAGSAISDNWGSTIDLFEINCKNRTYEILEVTEYNTQDEVITTTTIEHPRLGYISPKTMMEELYKKVCVKKDKKKERR